MDIYHANILINDRHLLGEGPVWDAENNTLHYVDILANKLHSLNLTNGKRSAMTLTQNIGCFALRQSGGYIMGLAAGIYLRDQTGREVDKLPGTDFSPLVRSNDGKCDPAGRFWCGTSDQLDGALKGELYCLPGDGRCIRMLDGLACANGLAFSGDQVYFIDSPRRRVEQYTLDEETMTLRDMRIAVAISPEYGVPDGMTMDEEGMLWVAHWGGGFVGRYDPRTGELLAKVMVPASQSSSCCFGGEDMQTLFITSAGIGRDDEPDGGKIFSVHLPCKGLPSPRYAG
ncbi:MAG: SMP-30/gluconolactonase/LRE family protein [Clostridia bacterium]|nr:SMP-30/gluconolactonase/LRE family protein [Clostridia bacterium]